MGMIRGFWNSVQVICGNHCNEQIEMTVQEGPSSLFYACPKYHPENRTEGERPCFNRLSLSEYENMLSALSDLLMGDDIIKLQGYRWKKNGTEFEVVSFSDEKIVVRVLNQRAIARSRGN